MNWLQMHWVDAPLMALFVLYAFIGWKRGAIRTAIEIGGFVICLLGAILLYAPLGTLLLSLAHVSSRAVSKAVGFVVAWLLFALVYSLVAKELFRKIPKRDKPLKTERMLGGALGVFNGALLGAFFVSFAISLPFSGFVKKGIEASTFGKAILERTESLDRVIDAALGGAFKETLTFITVLQGSQETVDLGFATDDFREDTAAERRIFSLVNAERTKRGFAPLRLDPQISAVARGHGEDMLRNGYFSHVSPEGSTPEDRAKVARASYRIFGENIAYAPDVSVAHSGLMNSPTHQSNILSTVYGRIGIGVLDAGIYGLVVVQNFAD